MGDGWRVMGWVMGDGLHFKWYFDFCLTNFLGNFWTIQKSFYTFFTNKIKKYKKSIFYLKFRKIFKMRKKFKNYFFSDFFFRPLEYVKWGLMKNQNKICFVSKIHLFRVCKNIMHRFFKIMKNMLERALFKKV